MLPDTLPFFARFIEKELGIVYSEHNFFQLQNRLEEIAKTIGVPSIEELHKKATTGISGTFKQLLLDVSTNNETSFFRDPRIFQAIEKHLVPKIKENLSAGEKLKIWSAASSFGQEIYSTAILLSELSKKGVQIDFDIFASDISERALDRAKSGRYSQLEIQRGLPTPLLVKYFTKDEQDYWTISPEIRARARFDKQNLKDALKLPHRFHLILCRNVLIYQKVESKTEIIHRISEWLEPGGYLILGAGESLLGVSDKYESVPIEGVVVYQLKKGGL